MSSLQLIYFLGKKSFKVVIFAVQKHVITSTNLHSYILRDFLSFSGKLGYWPIIWNMGEAQCTSGVRKIDHM